MTAARAWERPPPEETVARVLDRKGALGLTRLADITGLDRIGIPVVLSVRPTARYLSVDAGKGMTLAFARASAAMECVERHAGENARPPQWRASYAQVARTHRVMARGDLPIARDAPFDERLPVDWTVVRDLADGDAVAVPLELVALDRYRRGAGDIMPFQTGSNGLSAGNTLDEAILGGLCELIERDAIAIMRYAWERHDRPPPRLRLGLGARGIGAATRALLDRYASAGIEVVAFDCSSEIGVATVMVYAIDRETPELGLYRGYGCHPDPEIALQRALTEAAQGRLVMIAGSRDDLFGHNRVLGRANYAAAAAIVSAIAESVDLSAVPADLPGDPGSGVAWMIARLRAAGFAQILVADLTRPEVDIPAVRVIVPGLEGYVFESYAPGRRARRLDQQELV